MRVQESHALLHDGGQVDVARQTGDADGKGQRHSKHHLGPVYQLCAAWGGAWPAARASERERGNRTGGVGGGVGRLDHASSVWRRSRLPPPTISSAAAPAAPARAGPFEEVGLLQPAVRRPPPASSRARSGDRRSGPAPAAHLGNVRGQGHDAGLAGPVAARHSQASVHSGPRRPRLATRSSPTAAHATRPEVRADTAATLRTVHTDSVTEGRHANNASSCTSVLSLAHQFDGKCARKCAVPVRWSCDLSRLAHTWSRRRRTGEPQPHRTPKPGLAGAPPLPFP